MFAAPIGCSFPSVSRPFLELRAAYGARCPAVTRQVSRSRRDILSRYNDQLTLGERRGRRAERRCFPGARTGTPTRGEHSSTTSNVPSTEAGSGDREAERLKRWVTAKVKEGRGKIPTLSFGLCEGGWTARWASRGDPGRYSLCIPLRRPSRAGFASRGKFFYSGVTSCRAARRPYRGPAACTGPSGA